VTSTRIPWVALIVVISGLYLIAACGSDAGQGSPATGDTAVGANAPNETAGIESGDVEGGGIESAIPEGRPKSLDEWAQVISVDGELVLGEGVVSYELNSALFSDYALKLRTVSVPAGMPAQYDPSEVFAFPVGTVITKTFYYETDASDAGSGRLAKVASSTASVETPLDLARVRLIETRVLVHRSDGWHALPYVWNDDQTEATLHRTGDLQRLSLIGSDGAEVIDFPYLVPDENQCASCHATDHTAGVIQPIGPKARHLNRDGQLSDWTAAGLLTGVPDQDDIPRSAEWTNDELSIDDRARAYLDINCSHCHNSTGAADRALVHDEGVALIRGWIASLDGDCSS